MFLVGLFIVCVPARMNAQVTVGSATPPASYSLLELCTSNIDGGLRLPQLNTDQRNALKKTFDAGLTHANGLVIYNTDNNCVEYWNSKRWISLCEGNSQMTISPYPCDDVPADGKGCDNYFEITDPDCLDGTFFHSIVIGSEFVFFDYVNPNGTFKLSFLPNNSIHTRMAIIRVKSECTGLYRDFPFTQLGQKCDPALGAAPAITASGTELCVNGSVYLSVPVNTPHLDKLIWTRNNVEVARGVHRLLVTQIGNYAVHLGFIGCPTNGSNVVNIDSKDHVTAPAPVRIVVSENQGFVCDPAATVQLFAATEAGSSGTIVWYKDYIRTGQTGSPVSAGIGTWFAVVEENSCSSLPSNEVRVILDSRVGTPLPKPIFTVNGKVASDVVDVCMGGILRLEVTNIDPTATYTWHVDTDQRGTGTIFYLPMAGITHNFVLQVRATGSGCSNASISQANIVQIPAPVRPTITIIPPSNALCDGSATLTATPATGIDNFIWLRDGVEIATTTSNSLQIEQLGSYTVIAVTAGGCYSEISLPRDVTISSSSNANVTINGSLLTSINIRDVRTFIATMDNPQGETYNWTVTGATLLSGQGTNTITVRFDTAGTASITLTASNVCGAATVINAYTTITVNPDCIRWTSINYTPATRIVNTDLGFSAVNLSVTPVGGTAPYIYQWFSNTTNSNTGGTLIAGATNATYTTPNNLTVGNHYYYARITNCSGTNTGYSDPFTVIVRDLLAIPLGNGSISGVSCFDIGFSNPGGNCGDVNGRISARRVFTTHPTQVYTFTPVGTVNNLRFEYVNLQTTAVIQSIVQNGNNVTVTFNTDLDLAARGLSRANALRAMLHAIFDVPGQGQRRVSMTISVSDCACCPGLFIPNGAFTERPGNIAILPANSNTSSNSNTSTIALAPVVGSFTRANRDLCVYYRDVATTANTNTSSNQITWNAATANGTNMATICGGNNGIGVDQIHADPAWRIPNLAELAQIGQLVSNSAHGTIHTSAMTQAQVNERIGAAANNGPLPVGTEIQHNPMWNLRQQRYWSSTSQSDSDAWVWIFNPTERHALRTGKTHNGQYIRCVRTF